MSARYRRFVQCDKLSRRFHPVAERITPLEQSAVKLRIRTMVQLCVPLEKRV